MVSWDGTSEKYGIASAVVGNSVHTNAYTQTYSRGILSDSPRLRSLHAKLEMSAEAPIILDSIIKCHVITRYGVVHSLAVAPLGC